MEKRISREDFFMQLAKKTTERATCKRAKVGSVLVPFESTAGITGYCGSPKGVPHCTEIGCVELNNHCILTIHSEVNAILQAASLGISTKNATIFVTHLPCINCLKTIVNAKIKKVYYEKFYEYKTEQEKQIFNLIIKHTDIEIYKYYDGCAKKIANYGDTLSYA